MHSVSSTVMPGRNHVMCVVQDKITPATGGRQTALAILVLTSILILLPMLPSGTEQAAVSNGTFL